MKTLAESVETLLKILPKNAPEIQRVEMRKAFYSGAACLFNVVCNEISQLPEEKAIIEIDNLWKEIYAYFKSIDVDLSEINSSRASSVNRSKSS